MNLVDRYKDARITNCLDCRYHMLKQQDTYFDIDYVEIVCSIKKRQVAKLMHPDIVREYSSTPDWCYFLQDYMTIVKEVRKIHE